MPIHSSTTGWILETRNNGYAIGKMKSAYSLIVTGERVFLLLKITPRHSVPNTSPSPMDFTILSLRNIPAMRAPNILTRVSKSHLRMKCGMWF